MKQVYGVNLYDRMANGHCRALVKRGADTCLDNRCHDNLGTEDAAKARFAAISFVADPADVGIFTCGT